MKTVLTAVVLFIAAPAFAQVHVNGYTKKDGTYVQPHERTAPNNTNLDNYSTKGNTNPYTGQAGTKEPEPYGNQQIRQAQPGQQVQPVRQIQPIQPIQPIQSINSMQIQPLKQLGE